MPFRSKGVEFKDFFFDFTLQKWVTNEVIINKNYSLSSLKHFFYQLGQLILAVLIIEQAIIIFKVNNFLNVLVLFTNTFKLDTMIPWIANIWLLSNENHLLS